MLTEAAKRCESISGPSRAADAMVEIAINPTKRWIVDQEPGPFPRKPIYGTIADYWEWASGAEGDNCEIGSPHYTKSLDAAATLIPDGEDWRVWMEALKRCSVANENEGDFRVRLPAFLSAAALRRRETR